jgi:hypothetical protein
MCTFCRIATVATAHQDIVRNRSRVRAHSASNIAAYLTTIHVANDVSVLAQAQDEFSFTRAFRTRHRFFLVAVHGLDSDPVKTISCRIERDHPQLTLLSAMDRGAVVPPAILLNSPDPNSLNTEVWTGNLWRSCGLRDHRR